MSTKDCACWSLLPAEKVMNKEKTVFRLTENLKPFSKACEEMFYSSHILAY